MFAVLQVFFFLSQLLTEPYSLLRCSLDFSCAYFISLFIIIISFSLLCHPTSLSSLFPSSLRAAARDVSGLPSFFPCYFPSCISPSLKTLSVSGKFPLPYSLRAQNCHPHQCLTGVWTKSCSPGRELPSTASHPSFWEDFELPQKPQRAGRQLCDDAVMKQKNSLQLKA